MHVPFTIFVLNTQRTGSTDTETRGGESNLIKEQ